MDEKRELIYLLCKLLGYMIVEKDGEIKTFKWDYINNKLIRIL
jgi:hypothetical protein